MFSTYLNELQFTNSVASTMFARITDYDEGVMHGYDRSFIATLRALLANRMKDEDFITLSVKKRTIRSTIFDYGDSLILEDITRGIHSSNTICVVNYNGATSKKAMTAIEDNFLSTYPGWEELPALHAFISSCVKVSSHKVNIRFYINKDDKSAVIFGEKINIRMWHLIQSLISKFLPWYFDDAPLTENEKALVRSLTNSDAVSIDGVVEEPLYKKLINEIADSIDMRSFAIKNVLKGFETFAKRQRLSDVIRRISDTESSIERNIRQYQDLIVLLNDHRIEKDGLEFQINNSSEESEIMEYFMHNKNLYPIRTNGGSRLDFVASGYLTNFDPDIYETYAKKTSSYIYAEFEDSVDVFRDNDNRKVFLDAIFSDTPVLKIKMCGFYTIDLLGSVTTKRNYSFPSEFEDHIPNPHLDVHACLGNHKRYIEEALLDGDNIRAIEQCVCSTCSINIGESATFPKLLRTLFSPFCKKVIELPNGESVTPTQAFEWIKSNNQ